ncbi:MAG: hypothetical protein KDA44_08120 [Planctomycetales bacterium]|nr:hypothetical protein [Planctomycetales bacterium]
MIVALAALPGVGCRSVDNAQVDVMERELRQQESYIYELEDYLVEYSEKLRACRCSNPDALGAGSLSVPATKSSKSSAPKRKPLPEPELADDPLPSESRRREPTPAEPEPAPPIADPDELPAPGGGEFTPEEFVPSEIDVPELEIGPTSDARPLETAPHYAVADLGDELVLPNPAGFEPPADTGGDLLAAEGVQLADSHDEPAAAGDLGASLELTAAAPPTAGTPVQLDIRHVLRGEPADDAEAPQNLFIVVELLDKAGNPVVAAEQTSIMILIEDTPGSLQAVQRWDFTAEEAEAAWQSSALGDGLHFELPLRGATLPAGPVQIWARTLPATGDKLLAQVTLDAAAAPTLDDVLAMTPPLAEPAATPAARPIQAATKPATNWRQSTTPIGPVVEGFATTAKGDGWTAGTVSPATSVHPAAATAKKPGESAWQRR